MERALDRDDVPALKIKAECEKFFMKQHCIYMKKRYSKKVVIPGCIDWYAGAVYEDTCWLADRFKSDSDDEDSACDADEENEFTGSLSVPEGANVAAAGARDDNEDCNEGEEEESESTDPPNVIKAADPENKDGCDRGDLFVPEGLLTQPFHSDSSTDEESEEAQRAFVEGRYIPRSLVRDRDVGDAPLEDVVMAHRRRVTRLQAAAPVEKENNKQVSVEETGRITRLQAATLAEKENNKQVPVEETGRITRRQSAGTQQRKRDEKKTRKRKANSRASKAGPPQKRPFSFDFVSGLESDSTDDEADIARITARVNEIWKRLSL